jgi:hypothetical protein
LLAPGISAALPVGRQFFDDLADREEIFSCPLLSTRVQVLAFDLANIG